MKRQGIAILAAFQLALISATAQANIFVSTVGAPADFCATLAQHNWNGTGTAVTEKIPGIGQMSCGYTGVVTFTNPDAHGNFTVKLNLNFAKGHNLCPKNPIITENGNCSNDAIIIHNSDAQLTGSVKGQSADLSGHITFKVIGIPIGATVDDLHLDKA